MNSMSSILTRNSMSSILTFTDEEIWQKAKELGYGHITVKNFMKLKKDVTELLSDDEKIADMLSLSKAEVECHKKLRYYMQRCSTPLSHTLSTSSADSKIPSTISDISKIVDSKEVIRQQLPPRPTFTDEEIWNALEEMGYASMSVDEFIKLSKEVEKCVLKEERKRAATAHTGTSTSSLANLSSSSSDYSQHDASVHSESLHAEKPVQEKLKNVHKSYLQLSEREKDRLLQSCTEPRKVKRKTLRHIDGKSVIFEEMATSASSSTPRAWDSSTKLDTPALVDELPSNLLHWNSARPYDKNDLRRACNEALLASRRHLYRNKHDPVAMYHAYKKYWEAFKPPGENKHLALRWTIREKVLDYDFA